YNNSDHFYINQDMVNDSNAWLLEIGASNLM
ncbi:MAG: hypothetical protein HeimC2_33790, partial [Candidatus Heimdallarchaeota archaeon LC_2]